MAQLGGLLFFYFNFYHVVLVSAIQLKTAITMHPSPASGAALPSPPLLPSLQLITERQSGLPVPLSGFSPSVPLKPDGACY